MSKEVEVGHVPEGCGRKFTPYTVGSNTSMPCKGDQIKSVYLTFDPGGLSTINWRSTGVSGSYKKNQVKEIIEAW